MRRIPKARHVKNKTNAPPPGDVVADRFSSYALIANLFLAHIGPGALDEFVIYTNGCRRGMADSGVAKGSFLNIYSTPRGTLFCGGEKQRIDGDKTVSAEQAMYREISTLSRDIKAIIKKKHPKSLGITFGIYWDPRRQAWRDLTGQDPDLVNATSFPEADKLYMPPTHHLAKIVATDYAIPQATDAVFKILKRVPLTPEIAKQLMHKFSWVKAKQIAVASGYPIDPSEA